MSDRRDNNETRCQVFKRWAELITWVRQTERVDSLSPICQSTRQGRRNGYQRTQITKMDIGRSEDKPRDWESSHVERLNTAETDWKERELAGDSFGKTAWISQQTLLLGQRPWSQTEEILILDSSGGPHSGPSKCHLWQLLPLHGPTPSAKYCRVRCLLGLLLWMLSGDAAPVGPSGNAAPCAAQILSWKFKSS